MKRSDLGAKVKYDRAGSALVRIPGVGVKNLPDDPDMDVQTASPPLEHHKNAGTQEKDAAHQMFAGMHAPGSDDDDEDEESEKHKVGY